MPSSVRPPPPPPKERWQELVEDIKLGRVSPALALEPGVRASLEGQMKPDPERATQLRTHFQQGFVGIVRRLWPQLNLVLAVDSGSNQIYGEMLRERYCQGIPFYSPFYAATEGGCTGDSSPCDIKSIQASSIENDNVTVALSVCLPLPCACVFMRVC